LVPKDCVWTHC
jgi:hypothetical protein